MNSIFVKRTYSEVWQDAKFGEIIQPKQKIQTDQRHSPRREHGETDISATAITLNKRLIDPNNLPGHGGGTFHCGALLLSNSLRNRMSICLVG